jgi:hypothetical protein
VIPCIDFLLRLTHPAFGTLLKSSCCIPQLVMPCSKALPSHLPCVGPPAPPPPCLQALGPGYWAGQGGAEVPPWWWL